MASRQRVSRWNVGNPAKGFVIRERASGNGALQCEKHLLVSRWRDDDPRLINFFGTGHLNLIESGLLNVLDLLAALALSDLLETYRLLDCVEKQLL